jgi:hypothetical protein
MYRRIIEELEPRYGNFLFVHYEQVLRGTALGRLSDFLQCRLTAESVDPALQRTRGAGRPPRAATEIYARLCRLAGHEPGEARP